LKRSLIIVTGCAALLLSGCATSQQRADAGKTDNLRDAVSKPPDQQDALIKEEAAKLAKSQVPAADEAEKLALGALLKKPGLDMRETLPRVVGLYRIGKDVTNFANAGDLVWELHITRPDAGVSGVVWVSTTTKSAKVLFPVDP